MKIELNLDQLNTLHSSMVTTLDIAEDMVLDDLWIQDPNAVITHHDLTDIRKKVQSRIDHLVEVTRLKDKLVRAICSHQEG